MTDQPTSTDGPAQPAPAMAPEGAGGDVAASPDEHPERAVAGAFAGGLILALFLKRFAR